MLRILVIDDEKAIVKMLSSALTQAGFEVDVASNGLEGLRKYDSSDFDAVITDGEMPYLNGNEVVRKIRKSKRPNTPIIGISGTPWLLSKKDFDIIIKKPFSLQTLFKEIKQVTYGSLMVERAI